MKFLQIGVFSVVLASLVGCGTVGLDKRLDYGAVAKQIPNLEIPPDLTTPDGDRRYKLPQGDSGNVATFSDYSKGGIAQSGVASSVLPDVQGVYLERKWCAALAGGERFCR